MRDYLEVGDWSHDGHNQSSIFIVKHNSKDLRAAYARGSEIVGFDLTTDVCREYEDSRVSKKHYDTLAVQIANLDDYFYVEETDFSDDIYLHEGAESFAGLYMEIAKLGEGDDLKWELINPYNRAIHVGGYGLFFC